MSPFLQVVIGGVIAVLVGLMLTPQIVRIIDVNAKVSAGELIFGSLECLLFFASFWMGTTVLASAWLVFKTAAKWKTWDTVEKLKEKPIDNVEEIRVRYKSFLAGTAANLVAALVGAGVAAMLGSPWATAP